MDINELLQNIAPDTKKQVDKARNTWNRLIREAIRFESRLSLNPGRGESITDEVGIKIQVRLEGGYPDVLGGFVVPPPFRLAALVSEIRPQLMQLKESAHHVNRFLHRHQQESYLGRLLDGNFLDASRQAEQLLNLLEEYDLVRELLNTRQDVLGIYRPTPQTLNRMENPRWYTGDPAASLDAGEVILYWGVIGIVAPRLGVSIDALTAVVLTHELAHAYTQAGFDIDGQNWPPAGFFQSDTNLIEGLAQYYTARIAEKLDGRIPGFWTAYQQLLEKQATPYRRHLLWVDEWRASPEQIRHSMLNVRTGNPATIEQFEQILKTGSGI